MRHLCFCWLMLLMMSPPPAAAEFRAGAAAVEATPERLPVSMTGSFQDRQATEVHDPLHARALVLDDGTTRVAFVIVDSCLITRDTYDRAKRIASESTGIPAERMLTAATHTHTAPTAVPLAQCQPDPEYVEFLTQQIAIAIQRANESVQPARIAWGVGEEPDELNNRRWFVREEALRPDPFGRNMPTRFGIGGRIVMMMRLHDDGSHWPRSTVSPQSRFQGEGAADTPVGQAIVPNSRNCVGRFRRPKFGRMGNPVGMSDRGRQEAADQALRTRPPVQRTKQLSSGGGRVSYEL